MQDETEFRLEARWNECNGFVQQTFFMPIFLNEWNWFISLCGTKSSINFCHSQSSTCFTFPPPNGLRDIQCFFPIFHQDNCFEVKSRKDHLTFSTLFLNVSVGSFSKMFSSFKLLDDHHQVEWMDKRDMLENIPCCS